MAFKKKQKSKPNSASLEYQDIIKDIVAVDDLPPEVQIVLYGKAGTGKTTLAGTFPAPVLFIDIGEKGTDSVRGGGHKAIRIKSWEDLDKAYWYLRKEGGSKFKTVVIDTVSGAQELSIKKVLIDADQEPEEGKIGGWGTMTKRMWGTVSSDLKSMIHNFRELKMNVVFIAHDRLSTVDDDDMPENSGIFPSVGPRLMPSVASVLNAAVRVMGNTYIFEQEKVVKLGKGKIKKTKKLVYALRVGPNPYYMTKVRKPRETITPAYIVDPSYDKIVEVMDGDDDD